MKIVHCDRCKLDNKSNAKQYMYLNEYGGWNRIDLCFDCMQEFVIQNKRKVVEVNESTTTPSKKILFG